MSARYKAACLFVCAVVGMPIAAVTAAPLVYHGTLTTGDGPPAPFPALRFSVVDEAGDRLWWAVADPAAGQIESEPDGRFVALLDAPLGQSLARLPTDGPAWLRVEVCLGAPPGCDWLLLDGDQRIGRPLADLGRWISRDLELTVRHPSNGVGVNEFASIQDALAWLDGRVILPGARVTIGVLPGDYGLYREPIRIHREDGARLHIVGRAEPPQEVELNFEGSTGIIVEEGARLGRLANLSIVGDQERELGSAGMAGLALQYGARARVGHDVTVRDFSGHCVANFGGVLLADGMQVSGCGYAGFTTEERGFSRLRRVQVSDVHHQGIRATAGSVVIGHDSSVTDAVGEDYLVSGVSYINSHRICLGDGVPACLIAAASLGAIVAPHGNVHPDVHEQLTPSYMRLQPNREE